MPYPITWGAVTSDPTTSNRGQRNAWQSIAYRLIGIAYAVDNALDLALALVLGRDPAAVGALYLKVAPTLATDRKTSLLRELVAGDTQAEAYLCAAELLTRVRNSLAHSEVHTWDPSSAVFEGGFRGRRSVVRLWDVEALLLIRGSGHLLHGIWCLGVRHGDPEVVARSLGFLE